jgi:hypothetical protein
VADIKNNDDAYAVAQWLKDNKADAGSERYNTVRQKLVSYIDSNPDFQANADNTPTPPSAFGRKVLSPDDASLPGRPPPGPQSDPQTPGYSPANYPVPELPTGTDAPAPAQPPQRNASIFNPETRKAFYNTVGDLYDTASAPAAQAVSGLVGGADVGYGMAAAGIGSVYAGVRGLVRGATNGGNWDDAADVVNASQVHPRPLTPQGRDVAQGLGVAMGKVDDVTKEAAWRISGGNPALAALAYGAINMLPSEEGFASAGSLRNSTMNLLDKTKSFYERRGITLGSKKMEDQMTQYALDKNSDVPNPRGQALEPVIQSVRDRYTKAQADLKAAEQDVANSKGKVQIKGLTDAISDVDQRVATDYAPYMTAPKPPKIVDGEPVPVQQTGYAWAREQVQKLMDRESALTKGNARSGFVSLQDLDALRTQIKNLPGGGKGPIAVLHDGVDNFINTQIAKGFVSGDKNLTGNFKYLNELRDKYAKQFEPGTEVYRMATDLKASPEDFSKYIFNLSAGGYKTEAAQTVKHLAGIFGNNSPELDAMRLEFLGKVLEPLRGESPNWAGFREIYDKSLRNNRTLVDALSPYMARDLEQLYRLSSASAKVGPSRGIIWSNVRRNLIREAAGNSLARNNTKLNVYNTALNFVLAKSGKDVKDGLLKELTGVDRVKPLFRPGSPQLQTLWAGAIKQENDNGNVR